MERKPTDRYTQARVKEILRISDILCLYCERSAHIYRGVTSNVIAIKFRPRYINALVYVRSSILSFLRVRWSAVTEMNENEFRTDRSY